MKYKRGDRVTKEAFCDMPSGTKLLVGREFQLGDDHRIEKFLGQVVTFDHFDGNRWVYFKEGPSDSPFRIDEIECIAGEQIIDADVQYELGDMSLIFGEVSS